MFLLLSTPASIVQKVQKLNTSGDIITAISFSDTITLGNNKSFLMKNVGGNSVQVLKYSSNDIVFGNIDANFIGNVFFQKPTGATRWQFHNGSLVAAIDNSGHLSTDGGSTYVDVSALFPNFMKHSVVDATEYTHNTGTMTTKITSTITPSDVDNILLGYTFDFDLKTDVASTSTARVQLTDGTNTVNGTQIGGASSTYVTYSHYERVLGELLGQSSYTLNVQIATTASLVSIRNTTVVVYYLQKAEED